MTDWDKVRAAFCLDPAEINLAGMEITAHPRPVRVAIDKTRRELDRHPWTYFIDNFNKEETEQRQAVEKYFDVPERNVALVDGTTQALSLLYGGLKIDPGGEILTGDREFSYAYKIFESRRQRQGTFVRRIPLFKNPYGATATEIIAAIRGGICPHTRVLALTWVYSNTGVKLPIADIAKVVAKINVGRTPDQHILFCVDGVHGFGTEQDSFTDLGCDFFVAGCHKSVFGPRGTGIWCGKAQAWLRCDMLEPTSTASTAGPGAVMSPGGVHSYEHRWALKSALDFLGAIGKPAITHRIHYLAGLLKTGLGKIRHIIRVTPDRAELSSGVVCFDVEGKDAATFVANLREKGIIATMSSSDATAGNLRHVRFSVEIFNSEKDIRKALRAVAVLAS